MSTITDRPCKLGLSINTRSEKHGDDTVPACDIPLVGIMLEKAELNELVGDLFWESAFDVRSGGRADTPSFPKLAEYRLKDKYEGSVVIVMGPNQEDVELEGVKIKGITLEPKEGGLMQMSCSIQVSESIERFVHKLVARLNTEVNVEITLGDTVAQGKSKQRELPINTFGDGEKPDQHAAAGEAQAEALKNSTPAKATRRGRARDVH